MFAAKRELFTSNSTAGMRADITKRFTDPRDGIFCLQAFCKHRDETSVSMTGK
jgi:hypothetical protein